MENEFKLTPEELSLVADFRNAIAAMNQQLEGAIKMLIRRNKLEGDWRLADDKLLKVEPPKEEALPSPKPIKVKG